VLDRGAAGADGVDPSRWTEKIWRGREAGTDRCAGNRLEIGQFLVFPYPEEAGLAPFLGRRSRSGWKR
jgi:hypothetical protein